MAPHRFFLVIGLVVAVLAVAFLAARETFSTATYSTEPLVADMKELTAGEAHPVEQIVGECTGEGSFPAYVNVTLNEADLDAYRATATGLGWIEDLDDPGLPGHVYERSDRTLYIDEAEPSGVDLSVQSAGPC